MKLPRIKLVFSENAPTDVIEEITNFNQKEDFKEEKLHKKIITFDLELLKKKGKMKTI